MTWDAQPPLEPPQPAHPVGYDQYGQPIPQPPQPPMPQPPAQGAPQWHMPQPDAAQWDATRDMTQAYPAGTGPAPWGQPPYEAAPPFFSGPPAKRSRTGLYVGLGAGAAVVAGVVAAVVAMSGGSNATPVAQGSTTQGAGSSTTAGSATSTPNNVTDTSPTGAGTPGSQASHVLGIPMTAGPLRLVISGDTQQRISDLKKNLSTNSAYPDPQVGFYRVGSAGSFSVWLLAQSTANLADFQTSLGIMGTTGVMKQITDGAAMKDVTVENPGPLGGALDCGKLSVSGTDVRSCVWVDRSTFGWVYFLPSVSQSKLVQYTLDLRAAAEH